MGVLGESLSGSAGWHGLRQKEVCVDVVRIVWVYDAVNVKEAAARAVGAVAGAEVTRRQPVLDEGRFVGSTREFQQGRQRSGVDWLALS